MSLVDKLSDQDRMALDLAKMRKALALAGAEKALAQNEVAEVSYNNIILQLMIKYGLNKNDAIQEDGSIVRGKEESGASE